MKTSTLLVSLALALSVSAAPQRGGGGFRGGFGGNKAGNQAGNQAGNANTGKNNNAGAAAGGAAAGAGAGAAAGAAAAGNNTATGNNNAGAGAAAGNANNGTANNAGNGAAAAGNGDPQTSLTLDPKVIATGFANDGQDQPTAGQVASLTSTNNFINFCLTVPNLPITNGQQIQGGSCNPAPIGTIPSVDNMPSSKFTSPANGDTVQADTAFTVSMAVQNLVTGNFVNAQENYFAAPQQLDGSGQIVGHTHVVIETLTDLAQTTPTNPKQFAFFKGVNGAAVGGVVTADVDNGLPAGAYRMCSINSAANHQPVIVPIAQHGALDDCVYFTATANGQAAGGAAAGNATGAGAAAGNVAGAGAATGAGAAAGTGASAAAGTDAAGAAAASATAATGAQGGQQGQAKQGQQGGRGGRGGRGRRNYSNL